MSLYNFPLDFGRYPNDCWIIDLEVPAEKVKDLFGMKLKVLTGRNNKTKLRHNRKRPIKETKIKVWNALDISPVTTNKKKISYPYLQVHRLEKKKKNEPPRDIESVILLSLYLYFLFHFHIFLPRFNLSLYSLWRL